MRLQRLELAVKQALTDVLLTLPLNVLLILPESDGVTPIAGVFNLPAAINELLGSEGWNRAIKVMNPRILAPGWTEDQFRKSFSAQPSAKRKPLSSEQITALRVESPAQSFVASTPAPLQYAIRHYTGEYGEEARASEHYPLLDLFRMTRFARMLERFGAPNRTLLGLYRKNVRVALGFGETRLLILQASRQTQLRATRLARHIVALGGPTTLIVTGEDQRSVDEYLTHLYAGIIHNQPLSSAASAEDYQVSPLLVQGRGGDHLLSFDPWREQLFNRIAQVEQSHAAVRRRLVDVGERKQTVQNYAQYLHSTQVRNLEKRIDRHVDRGLTSVDAKVQGLRVDLNFSRESRGVFPLVKIAESLPPVEQRLENLYAEVQTSIKKDLDQAAASAPRVLNANFADPETNRFLGEREGLLAGRPYHLLVDVGPQWNKVPSIVQGHKEFPESALPASKEGFLVKVVFVNEEFTPPMAVAWMWVPRSAGRSFPFSPASSQSPEGKRAETSGPVVLPLTAPRIPEGKPGRTITAHGRLALYYEGNLLQSALVKVGVVGTTPSAALEQANEVLVDFALSNSLQKVEANYRQRSVRFTGAKDESRAYPVRLNLTLNDDGAGGHRILLIGRSDHGIPPAAWTQYKPEAAGALLDTARSELLACFYLRDANGVKLDQERTAQNKGNNFDQFRFDLRELAKIGSRVFQMVVGQVNVESNQMSALDWTRQLRDALQESSVIQIARTVPAEYVLPWALLYDIPLDGSGYPFCRIVEEEWSHSTGIRANRELRRSCPYAQEPWHAENVICPYGFWGLKHIIEQPPSQLAKRDGHWELIDAVNQFAEQGNIDLAVAVTRDTDLDLARVEKHIGDLKALQRMQFTKLSPADNLSGARTAFELPNIVYILCHGAMEDVGNTKQPFLGIGPRDGKADHRIFPNTIQSWAQTTAKPNLADWSNRRPLVFVNGCHTFSLNPDQMLSFVSGFTYARASGVLGTEVSMKFEPATKIARMLFEKLCQGAALGTAIRELRWELANEGNLIGLAYTLYGLADLHAAKPS